MQVAAGSVFIGSIKKLVLAFRFLFYATSEIFKESALHRMLVGILETAKCSLRESRSAGLCRIMANFALIPVINNSRIFQYTKKKYILLGVRIREITRGSRCFLLSPDLGTGYRTAVIITASALLTNFTLLALNSRRLAFLSLSGVGLIILFGLASALYASDWQKAKEASLFFRFFR